MGHNPDAEPPFFFLKPANAVVADGADFPYPAHSNDVHHEVELVVALGKGGANIAEADALSHVYGYAVGLDMTRHDLQAAAKKAGRPWETAKTFDQSAPCGPVVPAATLGHPATGSIALSVDGELRQSGDLPDLIWNIPATIAYLSTLFELQAENLMNFGEVEVSVDGHAFVSTSELRDSSEFPELVDGTHSWEALGNLLMPQSVADWVNAHHQQSQPRS